MRPIAAAGLLALTAAAPPPCALPSPLTLYKRVLESEVVAIARLRKVETPEGWDSLGDRYAVTIREVLLDRGQERPLAGFTHLDNEIPGSSLVGQKHPVAEDVDVLLFARRSHPQVKTSPRLELLSFCLNSVVPLRGKLTEYPGRAYEKKEIEAADFLAAARRVVGEFRTFAFLRLEFEQALGSRHPFNAWDKPKLLGLLLDLPDPAVPDYAAGLEDAELPDSCRGVLGQYLARTGRLAPLREKLDDVLARYRDGELEGTEMFRFPNGSMNPRREKRERLLDATVPLIEAQDAAFVAKRLLPLVRKGDLFPASPLIRAGSAEALTRTLAERARGLPAVQALLRSGERTATLAAIRIALAVEGPERRAELLAAVRRGTARHDPPAEDTAAAWQAFWRDAQGRFPAAFPAGTVDQHLGTDPERKAGKPR